MRSRWELSHLSLSWVEAELFVYDRNILELSHETLFINFRNHKLLKMERKLENLILVFEEFKIGYIRFGQLLLSTIFWFDNLDNSGISLHLIGDGRTFDIYFHFDQPLPEPSSGKMIFRPNLFYNVNSLLLANMWFYPKVNHE